MATQPQVYKAIWNVELPVRDRVAFVFIFFFQAEDGIRDYKVTGVQTCALPISPPLAFSAPGPCCMQKAPMVRPDVTREIASAMCSLMRSCRTITGRMSALAACSIR